MNSRPTPSSLHCYAPSTPAPSPLDASVRQVVRDARPSFRRRGLTPTYVQYVQQSLRRQAGVTVPVADIEAALARVEARRG